MAIISMTTISMTQKELVIQTQEDITATILFSYSTPVAMYLKYKGRKKLDLFMGEEYISKTTQRHKRVWLNRFDDATTNTYLVPHSLFHKVLELNGSLIADLVRLMNRKSTKTQARRVYGSP